MPGKVLSRPAFGGVRVWREAMNEVQDPVAPPATRLVPDPIRQHTGSDGETERGDQAQLPGGCERPGRNQKQRRRYRQTYLACEYRSEQDRVAMLQEKLDDSIHTETSAPGSSISYQFVAAYLRFSRIGRAS